MKNTLLHKLKSVHQTGGTPNDGEYVPSISHKALVTDDLFNQVQTVLNRKNTSVHYVDKIQYPLRGLVRCAHCHRVYTPYEQKGSLYYYVRCTADCQNTKRSCSFDFIAEKVRGLIAGLHLTENELAELEARTSTDVALLSEKRHQDLEQLERQKKRIREELAYLNAQKLPLLKAGAYTPESIVATERKLEHELRALQQNEQISDQAMRDLLKEVVSCSELLKSLIPTYDFANPEQKDQIIRSICSELFIAQNTLNYSLKKGLGPFSERVCAFGGPTAWLSEFSECRDHLNSITKSLTNVLGAWKAVDKDN